MWSVPAADDEGQRLARYHYTRIDRENRSSIHT